jgi:hypothetical protein
MNDDARNREREDLLFILLTLKKYMLILSVKKITGLVFKIHGTHAAVQTSVPYRTEQRQ